MKRTRHASLSAVVVALAAWTGNQGEAGAQLFNANGAMSSIWTNGPTKLVFATDQYNGNVIFEQNPTTSFYFNIGNTNPLTSINERVAPVVIQPNGLGTWETDVFYLSDGGAAGTCLLDIARTSAGWGTNLAFPIFCDVGSGLGAASNVYRQGDGLQPQGARAQIAVYFISSRYGTLVTATSDGGVWSSASDLSKPSNDVIGGQPIEVTSEFNNGVLSTSVWVVTLGGFLWENQGVFKTGTRTWINHGGGVDRDTRPAGVTWYDRTGVGNPAFEHTRVYVTKGGAIEAFYREPGGVTGWDNVDQHSVSPPLSAGVFVGSCGGCRNPPEESVVVGLISGPGYSYLAKDNTNTSPSYLDTWSELPINNVNSSASFTRMDWGGGLTIFSVNSAGHLVEWNPSLSAPVNHGYPGGTYSYANPVFDNADSRLYTGDGDWAGGEHKGECASNQWTVGVSASSTQTHSMECASIDTTSNFTASQHTLNISGWNDGFGSHGLGDWDYGYYKGECGANEMVTGLSLGSNGALNHVRCSSTPMAATNCRALPFPSSDNRETPNSGTDWAYGYFKGECGQGSAVAGISRGVSTGDVHAILCCDFGLM